MTSNLWVFFGLAGVLVWVAIPMLQEKRKVDGYALALWNKIIVATATLPFVAWFGLPSDPAFYGATFATAILWAIADVCFFRAVPIVGAAVVTRLIPSAIIVTFFVWFLFDPALLAKYLAHPVKSTGIALVVMTAAYFAFRLKRCEISLKAIKMIWFVIFASAAGSIIVKLLLDKVPTPQGVFAFVFVQALMMVLLWVIYMVVRKPMTRETFFNRATVKTGALVGSFSATGVCLKGFGLIYVEHPAYLSVILLLDSIIISLVNRVRGKEDKSDLAAGFGIVACALALVILKNI